MKAFVVAKRAGVKAAAAKAMLGQRMAPVMIGHDETHNYLLNGEDNVELKISKREHCTLIHQAGPRKA